jgi:hypothetical protein
MLKLRVKYLLPAVLLFIVEVCIALFARDRFIRPFVGDFLVVIFLYCLSKSFLDISTLKLAISILLFAFFIEYLQYIGIVNLLGLRDSRLANIIIGNSFEWTDLLAYSLGILTVVFIEYKLMSSTV